MSPTEYGLRFSGVPVVITVYSEERRLQLRIRDTANRTVNVVKYLKKYAVYPSPEATADAPDEKEHTAVLDLPENLTNRKYGGLTYESVLGKAMRQHFSQRRPKPRKTLVTIMDLDTAHAVHAVGDFYSKHNRGATYKDVARRTGTRQSFIKTCLEKAARYHLIEKTDIPREDSGGYGYVFMPILEEEKEPKKPKKNESHKNDFVPFVKNFKKILNKD